MVKDEQPVAEGELRHVFIDTTKGGTAPIPDAVRTGLTKYVAKRE